MVNLFAVFFNKEILIGIPDKPKCLYFDNDIQKLMKIRLMYIVLALLILIPSSVNLVVPIYNKEMPSIFGIPFFYWFQTVWLVVCSGFYLAFAYLMNKEEEENHSTTATGVGKFN